MSNVSIVPTFTGTWYTIHDSSTLGDWQGSYRYTNVTGSLVSINFYGSGISVYGGIGPSGGVIFCDIEGRKAYVDLQSSTSATGEFLCAASFFLTGNHTLQVQLTNVGELGINGFILDTAPYTNDSIATIGQGFSSPTPTMATAMTTTAPVFSTPSTSTKPVVLSTRTIISSPSATTSTATGTAASTSPATNVTSGGRRSRKLNAGAAVVLLAVGLLVLLQ